MDDSQKHYVEQKKPEIKDIYYIISFIWNPKIDKNPSKLWKPESGYLWGSGTDYKRAQRNCLRWWKCSTSHFRLVYSIVRTHRTEHFWCVHLGTCQLYLKIKGGEKDSALYWSAALFLFLSCLEWRSDE